MDDRKETPEREIQEHCPEHWFTSWERECLRDAERDVDDEEDRIVADREQTAQRLWLAFQNSATAVAQLYKDRVCQQQQGMSLWIPFQTAASAVTTLYKDGAEVHRRSYDHGIQLGNQRRTCDVLAWVKKRRRTIRREDLISFLCGKSPPPLHQTHARGGRTGGRLAALTPAPRIAQSDAGNTDDTDLQPFREAIALHDLPMSLFSTVVVLGCLPLSPPLVSHSHYCMFYVSVHVFVCNVLIAFTRASTLYTKKKEKKKWSWNRPSLVPRLLASKQ
uniref:HUWE1-associated protein modifying stress responses 1 isoform X3 n=1 Tax=Myxine glutinosa TaxID=7769 RepID=UPI00358E8F67